jgi:aspartyl-tRNA synthetase
MRSGVQMVEICGWCEEIRDLGKLKFIKLHTPREDVQVTIRKEEVPRQVFELVRSITRQSALRVVGELRANPEAPSGKELVPSSIEVLGKAETPLPLDPSGKTPAELETRLNWRFLDLRSDRTIAIFRVQNAIIQAFRDYMLRNDFFEIQPPCIIASASEGGAELFPIPYFEKQAFLAQSPQLYKQMCAIALGKVFCIVPVFRAEKFNKPTHLNEIRQMDVEMAFVDSEEDAMRVLEECLVHILEWVNENCGAELGLLGQELEVPNLPLKRISYGKAIDLLRREGETINWGQDFSKTQERKLWELVGEPAFFVRDWPAELKPFYVMPNPEDPRLCRAFDLLHNGLEVSSGTQRIHDAEMLVERIRSKGLDPAGFKHYVDCFRYGAPKHAGWSIGLERVTMTICGLKNIRECCLFPRDRTRILP